MNCKVCGDIGRIRVERNGHFFVEPCPYCPHSDTVTEALANAKPRIRVKAGSRRISHEEHFLLGSQWTQAEIEGLRRNRRRSIVINTLTRPVNWMG